MNLLKYPLKKIAIYSTVWIILLLFFFQLITIFSQLFLPNSLAQNNIAQDNQKYAWPSNISIPNANINVTVSKGGIENGSWILNDQTSFYIPTSGRINEKYNTVIYAHNKPHLFQNLNKLNIGEEIIITDTNQKKFSYKVTSKEQILPAQIDKIVESTPNTITLFTCDGLFDQKRLLVKAQLI